MSVTQDNLSLGEFVKQLAALLHKDNVTLPFKDQERWHCLFYELAKRPSALGKPKFFDELVFDWDAPYPKCQELSEFLHALHFTANVSAHNPRFEVISLDSNDADRWISQFDQDDQHLKKFLGDAVQLARSEFA